MSPVFLDYEIPTAPVVAVTNEPKADGLAQHHSTPPLWVRRLVCFQERIFALSLLTPEVTCTPAPLLPTSLSVTSLPLSQGLSLYLSLTQDSLLLSYKEPRNCTGPI